MVFNKCSMNVTFNEIAATASYDSGGGGDVGII